MVERTNIVKILNTINTFLNSLNNFYPLKFTWDYSTKTVNFLDLTVSFSDGNICCKKLLVLNNVK